MKEQENPNLEEDCQRYLEAMREGDFFRASSIAMGLAYEADLARQIKWGTWEMQK